MRKLWQFCRNNSALGIVLFFLAFIPLFPKRPLFDVVGTWVDIRLEDVLIAITYGVFGISCLRSRKLLSTPLTLPVVCYWIAGLISLIISLLFIGPHIPGFFPKVAALHYLRRIEYMGLFFVGFWAIRQHREKLPLIIGVLAVTALCIFVYGIGQKYQGWPAYSTMNEEFAKGIPLRLPPTARMMSTFAGHYDLAAYLVLIIPILGSIIFATKKPIGKILLFVVTLTSFILLLFTASRISFGVYLVTVSTMLWWQKKRIYIIPVIIASIIMVHFVSGASERFLKTFRFNDVVVDLSTGKPIGTLEKVEGGTATLERIQEPDEENLPKGSGFISVPTTQASQSGSIGIVEIIKKKDLVGGHGEVATISGSFLIQKAFVLDISITTRFQGQWPRAISFFWKNPITGAGYSVLSLAADGNYHRMLAETGLVGTITYVGIFLYAFVWFWKQRNTLPPLERSFVIGVFAGIVGLSLNAILIDVFEASKVAFSLWLLLGLAMGILSVKKLDISYSRALYRFFTHKYTLLAYVSLGIFFLYLPSIGIYFIGDDFTWLRWASQSSISDLFSNFSDAQGFFYRPIPKVWYFFLFSIFWLMPQAYHIASIILFIGITLFVLGILVEVTGKKWISGSIAILFASLSIHHENVYWISGQSSLLAGFFVLGACYFCLLSLQKAQERARMYSLFSFFFLLFALFSWDTLFLAPIVLVLMARMMFGTWKNAWILVCIPLYLLMRHVSGAVPPSGDYGVNLSRLVANSFGNALTYSSATFFGPSIIELSQRLRVMLRSQVVYVSIVTIGVLFAKSIWFVRFGKRMVMHHSARGLVVFVASTGILMLPYIGLGGVSDRYAFIPSAFLLISLGIALTLLVETYTRNVLKILIIIGIGTLVVWNTMELARLSAQWKFAGQVTEQTLLGVRKQFFPPTTTKTFVFVDTPIRYGRAWIFPTGLDDALWHMYRQTPFYFVQTKTIEEAFVFPHAKDTDKVVLQFEQFQLKEVVKEEIHKN